MIEFSAMAKLNEKAGSIVARCPGCDGGKSTFEWRIDGAELGAHERLEKDRYWSPCTASYRLFRCAGCGMGGYGSVRFGGGSHYPGSYNRLVAFYPEVKLRLQLPGAVPDGIKKEFQEAQRCLENDCFRAAAGLFRSVLDKTFRANGFKANKESLKTQIDLACSDGVITQSRKNKAHEEVRVLGNDVLHDEWHEIPEEDVLEARHYCQRVLEDFYDDRAEVEKLLVAAGRIEEVADVGS